MNEGTPVLRFNDAKFIRKVNALSDLFNELEQSLNEHQIERDNEIRRLLSDMIDYSGSWDETFKGRRTVDQLLIQLERVLAHDDNFEANVNNLCSYLYKCSVEFHLKFDGEPENDQANSFMLFCQSTIHQFDERTRSQLSINHFRTSTQIIKEILSEDGVKRVRELDKIEGSLRNECEKWKEVLDQNREEAVHLEQTLKNYSTAFNFVGLSKGFQALSTLKRKELKGLYKNQWTLTVFIILTILMELVISLAFAITDKSIENLIYTFLPFLSLVVVLLYFYRVNLANVRNLEAQLLQVDLRNTLCKFIQSYAEYAKELSTSQTLDKFESLIFSGISMQPDDIPTTFDGLEKITGVLKGKI
ncbi:hypothetical protein C4G38_RS10505 [Vibrio parahaemolyticus]|nr:hypothetical protein [Vibrio parahaemolyticus]EJG0631621.1 hypothetical protein [Vibrio parahaemolyticus]EJG0737889.1 hypothetical protein [Vibrio parahaemolyticus]EJG0914538.1 hypothetical protein [Vibrio parahaemolyticus]ELB2155286.1 hypothetical protein [Vibrio parahaemolyticus]